MAEGGQDGQGAPAKTVLTEAQRFRDDLLRRDLTTERYLLRRYASVYQSLSAEQAALQRALEAGKAGDVAAQLDRIKALRFQIAQRLQPFTATMDEELRRTVEANIDAGMAQAEQLSWLSTGEKLRASLGIEWNRLHPAAIDNMMAFLQPGSPLHESINSLGAAVGEEVERQLIHGITVGAHPEVIAHDLVRLGLGKGLTWALTTTRTAQIYAYREATRQSYMANTAVVKGWIWSANLGDKDTCMACIALHGSHHPVEEALNDHHRGRCSALPETITWAELGVRGVAETGVQVQAGEDWFKALSEAEQRERMGNSRWQAWNAGRFQFQEMVGSYQDKVYGTMRRERSLRDMGLGRPPKVGP
jgi:hypothetical protein